MNKKILVFGATGNTGIEICRDLDSKRINYSAFIRRGSETKIKVLQPNILFGDVLNTIDVDRVLKENDFTDVIIALGSRDFRGGEIRSNGTKHIVNSLNSNQKIAKLHVISANGVGNSW
ncbi:MAG: NAD(P)H-binding protein, partial [Flavobacteriales bacterium]|nr:NAD(P)H-binding protein [Flavobacteriales bacterium]